MKILILDDNLTLSTTVQATLTPYDHMVDVSDDARAAANMVEKGNYDFVLVDYKMPVNDGIWFMKNTQIPKGTKVLLMTAFVNKKVINEMFNLGAVGYLVKPFDHKELLRHLEFHSSQG